MRLIGHRNLLNRLRCQVAARGVSQAPRAAALLASEWPQRSSVHMPYIDDFTGLILGGQRAGNPLI